MASKVSALEQIVVSALTGKVSAKKLGVISVCQGISAHRTDLIFLMEIGCYYPISINFVEIIDVGGNYIFLVVEYFNSGPNDSYAYVAYREALRIVIKAALEADVLTHLVSILCAIREVG